MMKRIFTFTLLMLAFAMNAVAWEPVIKETHWFGMYEYYNYSDPDFNVYEYLDNIDFSNLSGWTDNGYKEYNQGIGQIGSYSITIGDNKTFSPTVDEHHPASSNCMFLEARWKESRAQYLQQTKKKLSPGTYRLIYDVQNVNSGTENDVDNNHYNNLFSVQIEGEANPRTDGSMEWAQARGSGWTTHILEFSFWGNDDKYATISLGFSVKEDFDKDHLYTPALFVSNLKLIKMKGAPIKNPIDERIIRNSDDNHIIEAVEVVKDWTGQTPPQRPMTTYYSWLDHQFRFSTTRTESSTWVIDRNNSREYEGIGLKNTVATGFKILNLKAGDKFSIEYYLDAYSSDKPYLANGNNEMTGSVKDMTPDNGDASIIESKVDYEVATEGNVRIFMPANAVIRSVSITLKEYKKATYKLEEYYDDGDLGYKATLTGSGVLEDKRGAVPYITMRYGSENDMTIVKDLGSNSISGYIRDGGYGLDDGNVNGIRIKSSADESPHEPTTTTDLVQDPKGGWHYKVVKIHKEADNEGYDWNAQFWVVLPRAMSAGEKFAVQFDYMADNETNGEDITSQAHGEPGSYLDETGVGNLHFKNEWQNVTKEITVTSGGMKSIALNLNAYKEENTYYFDNIVVKLSTGDTETFSNCFGASSIIEEDDNFNPDGAKLQEQYHHFSEAQVKDRLARKEWSVFTAVQNNGNEDFNSIWPLYGSYYYFFPEVKGKLIMEFYCEGSDETPAFWYKQRADGAYPAQPEVKKEGVNAYDRTNSQSHLYRYTVDVDKGGIYYLCSLPTNINHEHPIVRLVSYTFIPKFYVKPLYAVVPNGTTKCGGQGDEIQGIATIYKERFSDLEEPNHFSGNIVINKEEEPMVKCLGNVASAEAYVWNDGTSQHLAFKNIVYKEKEGVNVNKGGAIVANIECAAGKAAFVLTIAYNAENAEWGKEDGKDIRKGIIEDGQSKPNEIKRWDFFSGVGVDEKGDPADTWNLGQYKGDWPKYDPNKTIEENQAYFNSPKIWKETHKADGVTADWTKTYVNLKEEQEPIFKSVYDMEGDNADMLYETAGLIFLTESNLMGIYNENGEYNPSDKTFQDRYIGLLGPSELPLKNEVSGEEHPRALIIPLLRANDRIVIKMGCYGNLPGDEIATKTAKLKISGAYDATGQTEITGDYIIGGSGVEANNNPNGDTFSDKSKPFGEYHFVATGGENGTAKDFKLEVVEADLLKIYSIEIYRNAANDNADILTENKVKGTDENNTREILYTEADTNTKSIGLQLNYRGLNESTAPLNPVRMTGNIEQNDITVTSSDDTHTYSTPKPTKATGEQFENGKFGAFKTRIAVKTLQGGAYVTDYADCMVPVGFREKLDYPNTWDFTDLREKYVTVKENKVVTNGIDDATGNEKPVANGDLTIWKNWSLTAAPENFDGNLFVSGGQLYAGSKMFDETRGLGIVHNGSNGILSLTATTESGEGAISISNSDSYGFIVPQVAAGQAVYVHATPISGQDQSAQFAIGEGSPQAFTYNNGNTFAMKMADNASTSDVKLCFQGYEVNKIAVSTEQEHKNLNVKGWATESRDHDIDASLTSYMTGKDIKTYIVTTVNSKDRYATLTDVSDKRMPLANGDGSANACILFNNTDKGPLDIFGTGTGFHLFVPDMHDTEKETPGTGNLLRAKLTPTEMSVGTENTVNYVFTYQYVKINPETGVVISGERENDEMAFYRLGTQKTVRSIGNQAYLPVSTSDASRSVLFYLNYAGGESDPTVIDALLPTEPKEAAEPLRYYNLNGQQLDSKPNRSGLYIVNGKKKYIKIK